MNNKINYKEYLKSEYWLLVKSQVHKRDDYKCVKCESEKNLCVHHRTYEFIGSENLDELVTLCKKCHYSFHKTFPNQNYNYYVSRKRCAELTEKKEKDKMLCVEFIENNIDDFFSILESVERSNYIKFKLFKTEISNIIKNRFEVGTFIYYFMEYFDLVYIFSCGKEFKENYNFPKKIDIEHNIILVRKDFYRKHIDDLCMAGSTYHVESIDIRTVFDQFK